MKLTIDFPSIAFREGPAAVAKLAAEIERIGYDQLDIFDHVVMGFPIEGRTDLQYPGEDADPGGARDARDSAPR